MSEAIDTYEIRRSGLWHSRHTVRNAEGEVGVLTVERQRGRIVTARYTPKKGEVLIFRRDPGLMRAQFSLWTDGREWLGSSMRWSFFKRETQLSTGSRPYRIIPSPRLGRGWRLCAPKTGEMARFDSGFFGRTTRVEVYRRMDIELLLFAYFLAAQGKLESIWPGPRLDEDNEQIASASQA